MQRCFYLFLLLVALVLQPAFAVPHEIEKALLEQGYQEIPISFLKNTTQFTVELSLNKKTPQRFLIDNGTIQTLIFPQIEKEFSFQKKSAEVPVRGGGGKMIAYLQVIIPEMRAGNFHAKNVKAYYPQESFAELKKLDYVGILGIDFLRAHHAYVDTGSHVLFLLNKAKTVISSLVGEALQKAHYQKISLIETPSHHQTLMVSINNNPHIRFMLDTGSSQTLLSLHYAKKYKFSYTFIGDVKGAEGGNIKVYQTNDVKTVRIGDISLSPKKLSILDYQFIVAGNIPIYGTIGRDWMTVTQAVIDTSNNLLYAKG